MAKKNKKIDGENQLQTTNYKLQADNHLQGWKRALADYENLKRDLDKIKEDNRNHIRIDLAENLLPIIDNFEQAVNHVPDISNCPEEIKKEIRIWLQGVIFIKQQFEGVMAELGITLIEITENINPYWHEVVGEADETKVVSNGWKMGDRVLRPAKIIIKVTRS